MENKAHKILLNTMTIGLVSSFKVKNIETMAKINNLLTLDNYEMRRKLIEWKNEIEIDNNHYEKLKRDVASGFEKDNIDFNLNDKK